MSEGNNRRGHYPPRTTFDSIPVSNNFSPRGAGGGAVGRPTGNLPPSMASTSTNYNNNYGRNPYQGSPDAYFRGGGGGPLANTTVNNQPAKSKNKNEWNYYINQAAAVGKNKTASVPVYEENAALQQEANNHNTYTNWGPTSASIEQGTVFNGLAQNNFSAYNHNNNLRWINTTLYTVQSPAHSVCLTNLLCTIYHDYALYHDSRVSCFILSTIKVCHSIIGKMCYYLCRNKFDIWKFSYVLNFFCIWSNEN